MELNDWHLNYRDSPACDSFMLDSGAFTFMKKKVDRTSATARSDKDYSDIDWSAYLSEYIETINKHDIDLFFELDIDSVTGLSHVRELRDRLGRETGKQPIPVWHKSRGKQAFLDMCDKYPYVSIGGIVAGELSTSDFKYFPWFIEQAHDRNAKIHALGYSPFRTDRHYGFDSCDSTSWLTNGSRFGYYVHFNGTTLEKGNKQGQKGRCVDNVALSRHNLREWDRYVRYRSDNT